jgi:hypothetical protein
MKFKYASKYVMIAIFSVLIQKSYSQDLVVVIKDEHISPPVFLKGKGAFTDSIFILFMYLKKKDQTFCTGSIYMNFTIGKNGKVMAYKLFSDSTCFQGTDRLSNWIKNISTWRPAFNKKTKKYLPDYRLHIIATLIEDYKTSIMVSVLDKDMRHLYGKTIDL